MAKFVKIILFTLFVWVLNTAASNISIDKSIETQNHKLEYIESHSHEFSNTQLPYLPEGELTAMQSHQIVNTRIQRYNMLEYSSALRGIFQSLLLRDASLTQHFGKVYDTTTAYCCQLASEYYVFALKRIII